MENKEELRFGELRVTVVATDDNELDFCFTWYYSKRSNPEHDWDEDEYRNGIVVKLDPGVAARILKNRFDGVPPTMQELDDFVAAGDYGDSPVMQAMLGMAKGFGVGKQLQWDDIDTVQLESIRGSAYEAMREFFFGDAPGHEWGDLREDEQQRFTELCSVDAPNRENWTTQELAFNIAAMACLDAWSDGFAARGRLVDAEATVEGIEFTDSQMPGLVTMSPLDGTESKLFGTVETFPQLIAEFMDECPDDALAELRAKWGALGRKLFAARPASG